MGLVCSPVWFFVMSARKRSVKVMKSKSYYLFGEMEHDRMEEEKHKETLFSISVSSSHPSSLSPFLLWS